MSDWTTALQVELAEFARERSWERYHTPQNLAALISTEAGELLAHFRWGQDALRDRRQEVEDELADVFLAVLRFADVTDVDLAQAARRKLAVNRARYPTERTADPDRPTI